MCFKAVNKDGRDGRVERKRENKKGKGGVKYIIVNIWLKLMTSIVSAHLALNSLVFHFPFYEGNGNNENMMNNAYSYAIQRVQTSTFANL